MIEGAIGSSGGSVVSSVATLICRILAREGSGNFAFSSNPSHATIIDPARWDAQGAAGQSGRRGGYQSALVAVELADALVGTIWHLCRPPGPAPAGPVEWSSIAHLLERGCRSAFRDTAVPDRAAHDRARGKARGKAEGVAVKVRARLLTAAIMVMREHKGEAARARMLEVCVEVIREVGSLEDQGGHGRWGEGEEGMDKEKDEGEVRKGGGGGGGRRARGGETGRSTTGKRSE